MSLIKFSREGNDDIVKELLEHKLYEDSIDVQNGSCRTALIEACVYGHINIVKLLLDHYADPNIADYLGRTALIYASGNGHTDIVETLVMEKALDLNGKDLDNTTALMYASMDGYIKTVEILLACPGTDTMMVDNFGYNALMYASLNNNKKIIKMLKKSFRDNIMFIKLPTDIINLVVDYCH